ncbi:Protein of unknown function (DUF1439) [Idiomarina sp. A28L]|uniref:DUF1439 domain-containing protein n=1 Tax=Idiomarina sp. A28L TaxID=1036674 RepID=UPI0002138D83|nr:DUF1439 domain-containing protein [Idiomarina sp. A28L]EGN74230.1 Protein of unknown function (DUF1439) [Idiomarina sp. A28L]
MKRWFIVLSVFFLSACAQFTDMLSYRINESQLEQLILQQAELQKPEVRIMGFSVPLEITSLTAEIGPNQTDIVRLQAGFNLPIEVFGRSYPVALNLGVEGAPIYDGNEKAIYVRRLNVVNSSINAGGYSGTLTGLNGQVLEILDEFMSQQPVYRLNPEDRTQQLLMQVPLSLTVEEGALRISPSR